MRLALVALVLLFSSVLANALSATAFDYANHDEQIVSWMWIALAAILLVVLASMFFFKSMDENRKRLSYAIIVVVVAFFTLYVVVDTVQNNLASATQGPVHWHADYEVWVCGKKLELEKSKGIDGKIGTNLLHHHNDYRIHVEGTVMKLEYVSLGNFFGAIGGEFSKEKIRVVLKDGTVLEKKNADSCNSSPGKVQLYVNAKPNTQFEDYVIAPHSRVPPGDYLHIVFDSREGVPNGG